MTFLRNRHPGSSGCVCAVAMMVCASVTQAQLQVSDSLGTVFRLLEGGRFVQGTSGGENVLKRAFPLSTTGQFYGNSEEPAHVTWITQPFYMAETEVTVGQFRAFVQDTGYLTSAERGDTQMVGWRPTPEDRPLYQSYDFLRDAGFSWQRPGFPQEDDHPVTGVSWTDAKAYCAWLSARDAVRYRLPSEAEWEFACRAGTTTWFSFGDTARRVVHRYGNLGNVELERHRKHAAERQWLLDWEHDPADGHVFTASVGSYAANPWGLADMHGNVWEWCEDLWLDTIYKDHQRPQYDQPHGVAVDPINTDRPQTPENDFHTIRGGSWYNGDLFCRSASRTYWDREDAACYVGFRLVREAGSDSPATARDAFNAEQAAIGNVIASGGKLFSSDGLDIEVRFEGEAFDESALQNLSEISGLERLRIGGRAGERMLSQAGLEAISSLSTLKSLEFSGAIDPDVVDLSVLCRLHELRVLKFPRSAPLQDLHLSALGGLRSLTEFQCFGTNGGISDKGISELRNNRHLEGLSVRENQARGLYLTDFIGCPLQTLSSTRVYNGSGTFTDEHAALLQEFPQLRTLTLDGQSRLSAGTLKVIGRLSQLRKLSLDDCHGFNDDDFRPLAHLQRLERLTLSGTNAGDSAATAIAMIPRLQTLRMGSERLTDQGLADLSKVFSLTELQLDSNAVTDQGIRFLGRINRLQRLTIMSGLVTGSGLGPVADLPELRDLSLVTPALTDTAFDHLSQSRSLQKLRLAHSGHKPPSALTDAGLRKMEKATGLRELWLPRNDTGMTESTMNELQTVLSRTRIIPFSVSWK